MPPAARLLVAAALCAASVAQARPLIYRCSGADGPTYSQVPCPGGQVLESSDPRTAAQRRAAREVAERERRRAEQLRRERLAAEKAAQDAKAAGIARPPAAAASAAEPRKDFTAVVPGERKAAK